MSVNLSNYMVEAKHVHQIATEFAKQLQADTIASLGDADGLGAIAPGYCWRAQSNSTTELSDEEYASLDAGEWSFPEHLLDKQPPSAVGHDAAPTEVVVTDRSWGLVRLDKAAKQLQDACSKVGASLSRGLRAKAQRYIGGRIPGGYRMQLLSFRASSRAKFYAHQAMERLSSAMLKRKRDRIGIQRISTRKAVRYGLSRYSWAPCWRFHRGHPALPASVWKAHYLARLAKRRKTDRKRGKSKVRVPATKHGRPKKSFRLPKIGETVRPFGEQADSGSILQELVSRFTQL